MAGWKEHHIGAGGGINVYLKNGQVYLGQQEGKGFTLRKISASDAKSLGDALISASIVLTASACLEASTRDSASSTTQQSRLQRQEGPTTDHS